MIPPSREQERPFFASCSARGTVGMHKCGYVEEFKVPENATCGVLDVTLAIYEVAVFFVFFVLLFLFLLFSLCAF